MTTATTTTPLPLLLLLRWVWRRPCFTCERSHWPDYDTRLRQYIAMQPRCSWRSHWRYARWSR